MRVHPSAGLLAGLAVTLCLTALPALPAQNGLNRPPRGFRALFNGRDLTSWQGLIDVKRRATLTPEQLQVEQAKADEKMRAHWSVQDGVLVYDGKGDSLQTVRDYGDFELYVDWRIQAAGDSGIYLRGNPQVQIWDNPIGSGGLFNNQNNPSKPLVVADRPVGEWNTFHIKMVGDRVTIRLNDKLVVDNTPLENYWERGKPLPAKGPIELQHHGNRLEFRNIFIRELSAESAGSLSIEMANVTLGEALHRVARTVGTEIRFAEPQASLRARTLRFISIKEQSAEKAIELVSDAGGARARRLPDGSYLISERRL